MASNLPPGVSDCDIPGNRPEDIAWDEFMDYVLDELQSYDIEDAYRIIKIGKAAIEAEKDHIKRMLQNERLEGYMQGESDNKEW